MTSRPGEQEDADKLWADFVARLISPSQADTLEAALSAARREQRIPGLVEIRLDDGSLTLWGERADKFHAVARALARESRISRIASAQGVAKVLRTAVGRVLVDHGLGRGQEPHLYLNDVRATLERGVLDWTVVVAVGGVRVSGLPSVGLGNTRLFSVDSEEACRLASEVESVQGQMAAASGAGRPFVRLGHYIQVLSKDNVFNTCASARVRARDATRAVRLGLDAIHELLANVEVFRLLLDPNPFPLPIGLPHEFGGTIAPAVAFATGELAVHRIDMRDGYHYPLTGPLNGAFAIDPRVFDQMRTRGWDRLAAVWGATDDERKPVGKGDKEQLRWQRRVRSAAHWLGLAVAERADPIAFVNFTTALEALLLGDEDRERLATTFAERLAFVLSNQSTQRLTVFRRAKQAYSIRSKIVHGEVTEVADDDLKMIRWLALASFFTLLNDMPQIQRFQDLVDFCDRKKFESGVEGSTENAEPNA